MTYLPAVIAVAWIALTCLSSLDAKDADPSVHAKVDDSGKEGSQRGPSVDNSYEVITERAKRRLWKRNSPCFDFNTGCTQTYVKGVEPVCTCCPGESSWAEVCEKATFDYLSDLPGSPEILSKG